MPRPLSPEEIILTEAQAVLEAWDFESAIGFPLKIRQWRNRHSRKDERPVISIRFIEVEDGEGGQHTTNEQCWNLNIEILVDADLPSESSENDPTGIGVLTVACNQAFKALSHTVTGLAIRGFCDDVLDRGCGPDEDSGADEGRLVQSIVVLYRTPTGDRSVLLAPGVNV